MMREFYSQNEKILKYIPHNFSDELACKKFVEGESSNRTRFLEQTKNGPTINASNQEKKKISGR